MKRLALLVLLLPRLVWATCNTDSYSTAVCNMSPIRYFRMDAPSGTSETDLGSSATNGTYHNGFTLGATGIPALTDKAASFSGAANTYMDAGAAGGTVNGPSATNGVGWTAINWVKMTNAASGTGQFFFGRYNNGANQFQWFNYNVTSQIFTTIYGTCAGANATTISGPASANGTWYMVGFDTLGNGTNIDGDLCVNGVSGGTFTNKAVCANSGISTNISVADSLSNEYPLAGTIDEVATFPSRLACTTTQLALYNCGFNGTSCAGGAYNSNGLYMTGKLEDFGPQMPYPLTGGYKKIKAYADNPNSGPILPSIFHP